MSYEIGGYYLEGPRKLAPKRAAPRPAPKKVAAPRPVVARKVAAPRPVVVKKAAPRPVVARKVAVSRPTVMQGVRSGSSTTAARPKPKKKSIFSKIGKIAKKGVSAGAGFIPGGSTVKNIATQARSAGIKFKRKKKRGGGTEVVGVNEAGAVVTAPLAPNVNVQVEPGEVLPENAVQQAATPEARQAVAQVQVQQAAQVERAAVAEVAAVREAVAEGAPPSEIRKRVGRARAITNEANRLRDRINRVTNKGRSVVDTASQVLDRVDTAGEAAVAMSRAGVATAATGNAETGLAAASLSSPLVLGGIAVVALLALSGRGK